MKRLAWFLLLVLPGCPGPSPSPTPSPSGPPTPIPYPGYDCANPPILRGQIPVAGGKAGEYTVRLRRPERVMTKTGRTEEFDLSASEVGTLAKKYRAKDLKAFRNGFSAKLDAEAVKDLSTDPAVLFFHESVPVSIPKPLKVVRPAEIVPWGLDRVDQRDLPLDGAFVPGSDGGPVHVAVVDTGIWPHSDFSLRLSQECFTAHTFGGCIDQHDHGTHVAGTVAGTVFGVAKGVILHAVRVLDADGSGSDSDVIRGNDWVIDLKRKHPEWRIVATASLGGEVSPALDASTCDVIAAGVPYTVAAGNDDKDACNGSPARAREALTLGASNEQDQTAFFSNWGRCVDLYAPGVDVESARRGGGSVSFSGTSMATPHAAGVAALYLARHAEASPVEVATGLLSLSSAGKLSGVPSNTPNLLLYAKE